MREIRPIIFNMSLPSVALLALLSPGCANWQKPVPVETPAIASTFSDNGDASPAPRWWTSWNDTTLDALIEEALGANFSLSAAWARMEQAEASLMRSRANTLPSLSLSGTARNERREVSGEPARESESGSVGASISWEIDLWGRLRASSQASSFDLEASRQDLHAAAASLAAQIARVWVQICDQESQIRLLSEQIRLSEDTLKLIETRFNRGQSNASDLWQQQRLVENRKGTLILAEARLQVLRHSLSVLLGRDPIASSSLPAPGMLPALPPLPSPGVPMETLAQRPDVRAAWLRVQASDRRVAAAVADRFPRISLGASLTSPFSATTDLLDEWIRTLSGTLTHSVYDGGSRKAEVSRMEALTRQYLSQLGDAWLTAAREVEDALLLERTHTAYTASLAEQLSLAEKVFEQTSSRYQRGMISYLQVLEAQQTLQSLERNLLESQRQTAEYRIDLHKAIGGGFDLPPTRALDYMTLP